MPLQVKTIYPNLNVKKLFHTEGASNVFQELLEVNLLSNESVIDCGADLDNNAHLLGFSIKDIYDKEGDNNSEVEFYMPISSTSEILESQYTNFGVHEDIDNTGQAFQDEEDLITEPGDHVIDEDIILQQADSVILRQNVNLESCDTKGSHDNIHNILQDDFHHDTKNNLDTILEDATTDSSDHVVDEETMIQSHANHGSLHFKNSKILSLPLINNTDSNEFLSEQIKITKEIASLIKDCKNNNQRLITLELSPKNLGHINISLQANAEGGLTKISFVVSNNTAYESLNSTLKLLDHEINRLNPIQNISQDIEIELNMGGFKQNTRDPNARDTKLQDCYAKNPDDHNSDNEEQQDVVESNKLVDIKI